jgi:hypothetical protein
VDEIETCLVWDAATIESIEETKIKQQIADIRKDFDEEWRQMQGILEKYPNMFPKYDSS